MTLSQESIKKKLCDFVGSQLAGGKTAVDPDVGFSDMGVDSHGLLEVIFFLENDCGIILPDSELTSANLTSVSTLSLCAFRIQSEARQQ